MRIYSPEDGSISIENGFTKIEKSPPTKMGRSFFERYHDDIVAVGGKPVTNLYEEQTYPSGYTLDSVFAKTSAPWIVIKPNFEPMAEKISQEMLWIGLTFRIRREYRSTRKELDERITYWEREIMV